MARSKSELERDKTNISKLYLAGRTQSEIAAELSLSQPTVSRDLKAIQKRWMKETTFNLDQAKAAELARVDKLEAEYWKAWNNSKKHIKQTVKDKQGKNRVVLVAASGRHPFGIVAYLTGVQTCINQRRAILGLDAPKKQEHTGKDGGPIETKEIDAISDEERARRIAEILDAGRKRGAG